MLGKGCKSNIALAVSLSENNQLSFPLQYKHFHMKRVFLSAITVFELGNIISATANSSTMLILGRIVAGAGGGGVMTGSFIIIALSAKPQYRAAYMGVLGVTFGCASVVGPLLGGVLTDSYLTWRWCFWYVPCNRGTLSTHTIAG